MLIKVISEKPANIDEEVWKNITKVYHHHEDIDLFVGGLAEQHVPGYNYFYSHSIIKAFLFFLRNQ